MGECGGHMREETSESSSVGNTCVLVFFSEMSVKCPILGYIIYVCSYLSILFMVVS